MSISPTTISLDEVFTNMPSALARLVGNKLSSAKIQAVAAQSFGFKSWRDVAAEPEKIVADLDHEFLGRFMRNLTTALTRLVGSQPSTTKIQAVAARSLGFECWRKLVDRPNAH